MSYRLFVVSVAATEQLSATFRRLTLAAPELAELAWAGVDQRVKLLLPDAGQLAGLPAEPSEAWAQAGWYQWWVQQPEETRPPMRTYTVAGHRPEAGELDIDFAVHGDTGPLSRFALDAVPGDRLLLVAPAGGGSADGLAWRPGRARRLLCVGDETALPAIRNILAVLEADQTCQVVVEVPHDSDRLPLPSPARVRVDWAVRPAGAAVGSAAERVLFDSPASPDSPTELDPELWEEADGADQDRYAWIAGEVGWVNRLRKRLAPAGYGRGNAAYMGYWREGHAARG